MDRFTQQRHKSPAPLDRPRQLVVACPPMRSNVNLSRIVRAAGCCGVGRVFCCGNAKVLPEIARDVGDAVKIEIHRTLPPVLERLRGEGFQLVGLEQTTGSEPLDAFVFPRKRCSSSATSGPGSSRRCCGSSITWWRSRSTECRLRTTPPPPPRLPCTNTAGSTRQESRPRHPITLGNSGTIARAAFPENHPPPMVLWCPIGCGDGSGRLIPCRLEPVPHL